MIFFQFYLHSSDASFPLRKKSASYSNIQDVSGVQAVWFVAGQSVSLPGVIRENGVQKKNEMQQNKAKRCSCASVAKYLLCPLFTLAVLAGSGLFIDREKQSTLQTINNMEQSGLQALNNMTQNGLQTLNNMAQSDLQKLNNTAQNGLQTIDDEVDRVRGYADQVTNGIKSVSASCEASLVVATAELGIVLEERALMQRELKLAQQQNALAKQQLALAKKLCNDTSSFGNNKKKSYDARALVDKRKFDKSQQPPRKDKKGQRDRLFDKRTRGGR